MVRVSPQEIFKLLFGLREFVFAEQPLGAEQQRLRAGARARMRSGDLEKRLGGRAARFFRGGRRGLDSVECGAGFRFSFVAMPLVNRVGGNRDRHHRGANQQFLLIDFDPGQKVDHPGRFGRLTTHNQWGKSLGRQIKRQG